MNKENITVLPFNKAYYWIFNDAQKTTLTNKNLQEIDDVLKKCVAGYNQNQKWKFKRHVKKS